MTITGIMTFSELQEQGTTFLSKLWGSFLSYLPTLLIAVVVFALGSLINRIIIRLLGKGLRKSKLDLTVHKFLLSLIRIILYTLVFIIALSIIGIPMNSIIAVVGSAGIAVGLSMKDSLTNISGGFIVLIEKPFKAGDYVDIDGTAGTCEGITVLCTILKTPDNKIIYLPNGFVQNAVITNYSRCHERRVDWSFIVPCKNDFDEISGIIKTELMNHDNILKDREPFVRLNSLSPNGMEIAARAWVNSADYWDVYHDILEQTKKAFDKALIAITSGPVEVKLI